MTNFQSSFKANIWNSFGIIMQISSKFAKVNYPRSGKWTFYHVCTKKFSPKNLSKRKKQSCAKEIEIFGGKVPPSLPLSLSTFSLDEGPQNRSRALADLFTQFFFSGTHFFQIKKQLCKDQRSSRPWPTRSRMSRSAPERRPLSETGMSSLEFYFFFRTNISIKSLRKTKNRFIYLYCSLSRPFSTSNHVDLFLFFKARFSL